MEAKESQLRSVDETSLTFEEKAPVAWLNLAYIASVANLGELFPPTLLATLSISLYLKQNSNNLSRLSWDTS